MKTFAVIFLFLGGISLYGVSLGYTHQWIMAAMAFVVAFVIYPKKNKKKAKRN